MSKPFKTLRKKMSAVAQKAAAEKTKQMLKEMPLQELRQAHQMSQERIAELLNTKQANVSRIERRTDMYISTLRSYIEAMGGELDIVARFPDGEVHINQFEEIEGKHNEQASHSTLEYGDRFTIIRNLKDELKTGTFNAMLKQLGINKKELKNGGKI